MDKPKVTDEHLKKYDEIMNVHTQGKSAPTNDLSTPPPEKDKIPKSEEKPKPEEKPAEHTPEPNPSTNPGASDLASKGFVFTGKKIMSLDGKEKKDASIPGAKKHSSKPLLIIVGTILLMGWGIFWAFFFGYIKF